MSGFRVRPPWREIDSMRAEVGNGRGGGSEGTKKCAPYGLHFVCAGLRALRPMKQLRSTGTPQGQAVLERGTPELHNFMIKALLTSKTAFLHSNLRQVPESLDVICWRGFTAMKHDLIFQFLSLMTLSCGEKHWNCRHRLHQHFLNDPTATHADSLSLCSIMLSAARRFFSAVRDPIWAFSWSRLACSCRLTASDDVKSTVFCKNWGQARHGDRCYLSCQGTVRWYALGVRVSVSLEVAGLWSDQFSWHGTKRAWCCTFAMLDLNSALHDRNLHVRLQTVLRRM